MKIFLALPAHGGIAIFIGSQKTILVANRLLCHSKFFLICRGSYLPSCVLCAKLCRIKSAHLRLVFIVRKTLNKNGIDLGCSAKISH